MNAWVKNARKNLLPLSMEKDNLTMALSEWSFTGDSFDYENVDGTCGLCEMEGLRYHFEISNALKNTLWVGSKCIERFDIAVFDEEGIEIAKTEKEAYLKNRLKEKHVADVLLALEEHPSQGHVGSFEKVYLDRYCFTQIQRISVNARVLNYLFMRLDEEGIAYNKRFFSINIRSDLNKEKLSSLNITQFERIRNALSISQIAYYQKNKRQ